MYNTRNFSNVFRRNQKNNDPFVFRQAKRLKIYCQYEFLTDEKKHEIV